MAAGVEPLLILWSSLLIGGGGPHLSSTSCVKAFPCVYSVSVMESDFAPRGQGPF